MIVEIRHPNGIVASYDDAIVEGSVITAYHSGYFRVTKVDVRSGTPLFNYLQVAKADGTPVNGKVEKCCDGAYCALVNREFLSKQHDDQLKAADHLYDSLMSLLS